MGCSRCCGEQHDPEVGAVDSENVAVQLQQADSRVLDGLVEKKLPWIEGTTARFDGYLEFQRRPQPMLDWFAQYMS